MRSLLLMGLSAAALALAVSADAAPTRAPKAPPAPPQAASAERAGQPAAYREGPGKGYSAEARRKLDCLASDRRYDPASDRIRLPSGATRRCPI